MPVSAPVRRTKLLNLILNQLRDYAITHGLAEDDRLPPERDLAAQLSVSRPSLRNALDWLSQRGALRRVQGGGTFLRSNFLVVLAQDEAGAELPEDQIAEVVEARVQLEPMLIRMAAGHIKQQDLEWFRHEFSRVENRLDNLDGWRHHDLSFHVRLSRLSGNSILAETLDAIFPRVLKLWTATPGFFNRAEALSDHRAIIDALGRGDAEMAARRMYKHVLDFKRSVMTARLGIPA
jgi:GntR family transcriptional repressor for pyruvate dehydrogenase complex